MKTQLPTPAPRACLQCRIVFQPKAKRRNQRFCSRQCARKAILTPEHNARVSRISAQLRAEALRGRGDGKGYPKLNGRHAHRVVAEQMIGRPLLPGEIVHHLDDNKKNNDPSNLVVLASQSEHARLHFKGVKHSPEHVAKRIAARLRTLSMRADDKDAAA